MHTCLSVHLPVCVSVCLCVCVCLSVCVSLSLSVSILSGTDSGLTWTAANSDTSPKQVIALLSPSSNRATSLGFATGTTKYSLGTITFTRTSTDQSGGKHFLLARMQRAVTPYPGTLPPLPLLVWPECPVLSTILLHSTFRCRRMRVPASQPASVTGFYSVNLEIFTCGHSQLMRQRHSFICSWLFLTSTLQVSSSELRGVKLVM